MTEQFERILITGAAGALGSRLREGLRPMARRLRLHDREDMGAAAAHEEIVRGDLADFASVLEATRDVDAIVHFGGAPMERPWQTVLDSSIRGSYHIYEGARQNKVPRVVYASSIHAVGYYAVEDSVDTRAMHRPDSLYGLSKCFTEDLARLYYDKFGVESVCLRICSCFEAPEGRRHMWSFLTYADMIHLVRCALRVPRAGYTIIYGNSDNEENAVSNRYARHIGFRPRESVEPHRARVFETTDAPDAHATDIRHVGGFLCALGHPDDSDDWRV
ncbi:MAG: NAD(P)-dependent oxidoreductase [Alphaproteobacteria bacterium]|nr:NAD(P)-dependent oxidoreductase [Alphaproteobacteria bacterium]MDA7983178.1 NAD(P)-dependent oxidoreductase [Alphaproteobacteria bacterium]MDA7984528.1 NAD(P)-dependent oxidoreductase [Alphaproteobacteria bacterium]MDA7989195.1 NAD(P)-dependent oxidoreductase [Alphaproteobacteria bacterium]MDA8010117.1 NAD(P)-dependent oxidoreductase [Alphaproteobacteria bacterium]